MLTSDMSRVGQNHIYHIYGVHTVFLAGKSPYIRSHTVLANPINECLPVSTTMLTNAEITGVSKKCE